MSLTVGHIAYLNCPPFFHYLRDCGFSGELVDGVPAELNRLLAAGTIDLAPSSSFEYARNWRDYLLLPEVSISAAGAVQSVLLFSAAPLEALAGSTIVLTAESATSVNLLKVLCREYLGLSDVTFVREEDPAEGVIAGGGAALLIGDRALRSARCLNGLTRVYDLGELWQRHTQLPFVFALWIVRRAAAAREPQALRRFQGELAAALTRALDDLPALAAAQPEKSWMGEGGLVAYWQQMSYRLDAAHLEGLKLFFALCVKHGLLAEEPELHFV